MRAFARLLTAAFALASARGFAQTGVLVPTSTGRPDAKVLALREMSVDVGVARGYARVNVRQVFENRTDAVQEGTWRFVLPPSGAVGDFAVWDGNVRIPGVILEKRRARRIYEELTRERIDPGLLQQGEEEDRAEGAPRTGARPSGGAAFSVKVSPIPARGTKRLEMQFQHEVPWLDGVAEYRFPFAPRDGEPALARELTVRVTVEDGRLEPDAPGNLQTSRDGSTVSFTGRDVRLEKDLVVRFRPDATGALALSAFRNPSGALPDGLALAPWERPSDVPPEKDGFFLLEYRPEVRGGRPAATRSSNPARAPLALAVLFDTSLSVRWGGLESAWAELSRTLDALSPADRFTLLAFDRTASPAPGGLAAATPEARANALAFLRSRPLGPGTDVAAAVRAARVALAGAGSAGRILLLSDGASSPGDLAAAASGVPLFTFLTGEERPESYAVASAALALAPARGAEDDPEAALFRRRLFEPATPADAQKAARDERPAFRVEGGKPGLRDVYPVLTQPPTPGSLSGWVGRYASPATGTTVILADGAASANADFPETALEARDLPRRWARARVDALLALIEMEGEKREWVEEILALSRRYKFVTPYTAFLAAPRALLRPRRIQPGDPVIRVEADAGTVAATALLPFGRRVPLRRRPGTSLWEGRFLVPDGHPDGPLSVRLVLRDVSGRTVVETKRLVVDGTPPRVVPEVRGPARAGTRLRVAARADADVVFLSARLGDGLPVPLRWDPATKTSVAELPVPAGSFGDRDVFFEAADAAGNRSFARARVDVR